MAKEKKQKIRRPRAQTPRGFADFFGADVLARDAMLAKITEVYHRYGFAALESPLVETVEALGKFLPDVDRPNEGVFAWEDDGDWVALRYDLTAPLARVVAQHRNDLPSPYRRYAVGPVFRNEKPGPGRFRQFYQCDADTVGSASPAADAEICAMLCDALEAAGIARGDYVLRLNNRKVLDGMLESVGAHLVHRPGSGPSVSKALETASSTVDRDGILRTIDKFDKVGRDGVFELLTKGRLDASGAFVDGVGLDDKKANLVLDFLTARGSDNTQTLERLSSAVGRTSKGAEGVKELGQIAELLDSMGFGPDRIVIDPSIVRGLGYYTGPVYEAELTFEILDEQGRPRQFGSVAGGGRYDDLVKRFTGQDVPATGVSIGVDRLLAALKARQTNGVAASGPVVVTVMDRDRMPGYLAMASELRAAGIRAEVYLGNPRNFGNQLKYADRRSSPIAVIEGDAERAQGVVVLKDLALGAALAAEIESNADWKAHPAQTTVPRAALVSGVKQLLARER
ncbi:MAG: histidine--tRNA ligase [Pseudomonadota bacterium]